MPNNTGVCWKMLPAKRGRRGLQTNFRCTPEQDELLARADLEGVSHTVVLATEWRAFRAMLDDQLRITRAARGIRLHNLPHLLTAWPIGTDYTTPDQLRALIIATLGERDDLAVRIIRSRDLAVMALAWGVMKVHAYQHRGMELAAAAREAGIIQ
jgi:hypothetical protein